MSAPDEIRNVEAESPEAAAARARIRRRRSIALGIASALIHLPIVEKPVMRAQPAAA